MTYGNSKLSYGLIELLALISAPGISIYNGPLLMHNSPLLGYNSPSASDVSGLIYVNGMTIKCSIESVSAGVLV